MKLKDFLGYFTFTKLESRAIILIILAILVGTAIKIVRNQTVSNSFDFESFDKEFIYKTSLYQAVTDLTSEDTITNSRTTEETNTKKTEKGKKEQNLKEKSININTATKDELIKLPGVGPSTAEKIIEYREKINGFKKIEDIMKVKGIGQKKFEKMKPYIFVE
ncbi:MAG: ComEA family DNA-binding protein [Ignavibacteria bacterium]